MTPANPYDVSTVRCAGCGIFRGEANKWFVVTTGGVEEDFFHCQPFHKAWVGGVKQRPVCGHACSVKLLGEYLAVRR